MRILTQCEVESVSGGMSWSDIWNAAKKWLNGLFGNSGQDADGALNNAVNGCTSNGGTANYTVNGGSYTVNTGAGGTTAGDDGLLSLQLHDSSGNSVTTWSLDCSNAHSGGNGQSRSGNQN